MKNKSVSASDRRRFFRIDDTVNIFYRVVDEQTALNSSELNEDLLSSCSLVTALDVLEQESRMSLHWLEKHQPEVADYLKVINSKVNLLAQAVLKQGQDFSDSSLCETNISASGLSLGVETPIEEGKYLEIKLLLTSTLAVIVLYGKVVYCKKNNEPEGKPYQIAIDYVNLRESDREILIKHIVKRQMQQIRESKED